MLPIKLKMCGFLSYLNETEIDFTKFGEKGLYLITGDTGAGKTTIFDAISYALYGKASGKNREVKLFRSKNADESVPTYVELTFMSGGKKYKVRRNPEYEQKAKKGSGTSVCRAKVMLTEYDGGREIVKELKSERKSDDKDPIARIVGIDSEKFRQLSMIAQGDFDRVITAKTGERTEILRAIFSTEKYERLQRELAETADRYKTACEELLRRMTDKLMQTSCSAESPLKERLDKQKALQTERNSTMPAEEITALIDEVTAEDRAAVELIKQRMETLNKSLEQKHKEIGTAQEREKKRKSYIETRTALETAQKLLPERQAGFDAVAGNNERAAELLTQKKLLEEKRPLYQELAEHRKGLAVIELQQRTNGDERKKTADSLEAKTESLKKMSAEIEALRDADQELLKVKFSKDENEKRREKLAADYKLIQRYIDAIRSAEEKAAAFRASKADSDRLRAKYNEYYEAYISEQAGYIAETLVEGKPCPVCGSLTHPARAQKPENAPSKDQVDTARKDSAAADSRAADDAAKLSAEIRSRDELKTAADELSTEFFGEARDIQELRSAVIEQGKALKEQITAQTITIEELEKKTKRKSELEKKLPETEQECERLRNSLADHNTAAAVLAQSRENELRNIERITASLPFETSKGLEDRITELANTAEGLAKLYTAAEKALADCKGDVSRYRAALDALGEVSEEPQEELIARLESEAAKLRAENEGLNDELLIIGARIKTNTEAAGFIRVNAPELEKKMNYYLQANELDLTANGKLKGGQEKINLEVYAQERYFEGILSLSNVRLMKMSNNKYEFIRSKEALSKRGQSGLEIDVIDHDSATQRSVRSLSGGESFMASLALALGFSDTIQTAVGGVALDTIFIDEGFGTLDGNKLSNTYGVFNELGTDGKCLVGIISHVDELKKRIPNQIVITKDSDGNSHAAVKTVI